MGKSTIFNRIVGRRISIVHPTPGVTRDRVFAYGEWQDKIFGIFDTGGFWPDKKILFKEIEDQIQLAIEESDLILLVIDGKTGVTPLDEDLYRMVKKTGKQMLILVNKVDNPARAVYDLPFKDKSFMVSAVHGHGFYELLDEIARQITEPEEEVKDHLRILILGRPNVGKSTLLNRLTGKKRAVVEPTPGTTRDPLSDFLSFDNKPIEIIDTAGVRRRSKVKGDIEFYSVLRALKMIPTSDLVILLFDAVEGPVKQDLRLAELIFMRGKGIVVVPNKIDLLKQKERENLKKATRRIFSSIPNCPVVEISAKKGTNLDILLKRCFSVYEQGQKMVALEVLKDISTTIPPPPGKNRIHSIKQISAGPPVFEVRSDERLPDNYIKFLKRKLRHYFNFSGQPIIIKERCRT